MNKRIYCQMKYLHFGHQEMNWWLELYYLQILIFFKPITYSHSGSYKLPWWLRGRRCIIHHVHHLSIDVTKRSRVVKDSMVQILGLYQILWALLGFLSNMGMPRENIGKGLLWPIGLIQGVTPFLQVALHNPWMPRPKTEQSHMLLYPPPGSHGIMHILRDPLDARRKKSQPTWHRANIFQCPLL